MMEAMPAYDAITSVCEMYLEFLSLFHHLSSDILIGLGCNEAIVFKMWCFLRERSKLHVKNIFGVQSNQNILSLFSQMMLYMLV